MFRVVGFIVVLYLFSGCSGSSLESTESPEQEQSFLEALRNLSGNDATDCRYEIFISNNEPLRERRECVVDAFNTYSRFFSVYTESGFFGETKYGLAFDGVDLFVLENSSFICSLYEDYECDKIYTIVGCEDPIISGMPGDDLLNNPFKCGGSEGF